MSPEFPWDLPKLFGEFFRASNARRSGILGTGVGLAGVKDLVERFRGRIEVETEEGRGTTFRVHLPGGSASCLNAAESPRVAAKIPHPPEP